MNQANILAQCMDCNSKGKTEWGRKSLGEKDLYGEEILYGNKGLVRMKGVVRGEGFL
jgi:hypothetical protein